MLSSAWRGILSMMPTRRLASKPAIEDSVESKSPSTSITPEEISSSDNISELKLSKDGSRVAYTVGPLYKDGENKVSALWLADTFIEGSARQITQGANRDFSPTFHPTSSSEIYFLSDRDEAGGSAHLFKLSVDVEGSVVPVVVLGDRQSVASFSISPDGQFLAFTLETKVLKKGEKETIQVWRENKHLRTLNVVDLADKTKSYRTLKTLEAHVESFSWSPDSSSILYRTISHLDIEARYQPASEVVITLSTEANQDAFEHVRQPNGPSIWRERGDIVFVQGATPSQLCSASSLWSRKLGGSVQATRVAYGNHNDVGRILDLGVNSQYVVEVAENLITKLDVHDRNDDVFAVFQTSTDHVISAWDIVLTEDGRYILVAKKSSVVSGEIENIWSGVSEQGKEGILSKKLSSHNAWFDSKVAPDGRAFFWTSSDGVKMEGVINYPRGTELKNLPTVVVAHGGPSSRDVLELGFSFSRWRPFLASHGYLVLSPNYRGGTGRGDTFAMAASGGVGGIEWSDIEGMIEEGISQGLVDPDRVGIAGYSQGGFLSAWGVTRPNGRFKVGVIGAGVTDWGILAATSDIPEYEAALGGSAPWTPGKPLYLRGSPLKDAQNVTAPILFLHGKSDARVPVSQAVALLRGIEREGKAEVPPQLVTYPREDHGFEERANVQDILQRLLDHIDKYL